MRFNISGYSSTLELNETPVRGWTFGGFEGLGLFLSDADKDDAIADRMLAAHPSGDFVFALAFLEVDDRELLALKETIQVCPVPRSGTLTNEAPFYDALGISIAGSEYVTQLYAWKPDEGFLAVGRSTPFQTNGYFESIGVTIWFVGSFTPALVQVRAWHLPGGATFEDAVAAGAWTGVSETLVVPEPGFGGGFPPSLPALLIGLRYL